MSTPPRWVAASVALGAMAAAIWIPSIARGQQAPPERSLHVFFSPNASLNAQGIERIKKALRADPQLRLRTILLVEDFKQLGSEPSGDFRATVNALREFVGPEFGLQLYDEGGLDMASRFSLTRLPAVAVERGQRVHVAYGTTPDIEALLRCAK